jgi:predicted HicB family RNase H-like nuclease
VAVHGFNESRQKLHGAAVMTRKKFTLRMPKYLMHRITEKASAEGISVNAWVLQCLDEQKETDLPIPKVSK